MDKIKNYIFDLDGTLINSCEEVMQCFEKAFELSEYPIDKSRLTDNLIGPPLREIVQNIAPELKDEVIFERIIKNFRNVYDNDTEDKSKLYDGILDKLAELKNNGNRIFLATLKPTKPTKRILRDFGLNIFEDVYTIDKFEKFMTKTEMITDILKKYDLDKTETVMIGDAASDVIAAKEAGIAGIGAMWGYGSDKTALIRNSKFVIKNIREL